MNTYKREKEELFHEIMDLKQKIQSIASIVQNEGTTVTDDEMIEWVNNVDGVIDALKKVKFDVVVHYEEEGK